MSSPEEGNQRKIEHICNHPRKKRTAGVDNSWPHLKNKLPSEFHGNIAPLVEWGSSDIMLEEGWTGGAGMTLTCGQPVRSGRCRINSFFSGLLKFLRFACWEALPVADIPHPEMGRLLGGG